jgi:hypothetical protein
MGEKTMRVKQDRVQGPTAQWLLEIIEEFLTLNELDNDGCLFGWVLSKDRTLVQRLRDGGDVTTSKMDEILAFVQNPVSFASTGVRKGLVRNIPLKPITIKPKELP